MALQAKSIPVERGRRPRLAECVAAQLRRDLTEHIEELSTDIAISQYMAALEEYPLPFTVRRFSEDETGAAFIANKNEGSIEFNIANLNQVVRSIFSQTKEINKLARRDICQLAMEQYFLHETYHIAQRLVEYPHVQVVASTTSAYDIGELDLEADVFAAKCGARLACLRQGVASPLSYYWELLQQLTVMLAFWLPMVKAPDSKPHKQARFLGLAMMVARINRAIESEALLESDFPPYDAALYPRWNETHDVLVVYALSPNRSLLWPPVNVDSQFLRCFLHDLDIQKPSEIIQHAQRLLAVCSESEG